MPSPRNVTVFRPSTNTGAAGASPVPGRLIPTFEVPRAPDANLLIASGHAESRPVMPTRSAMPAKGRPSAVRAVELGAHGPVRCRR